MLLIFATVKIHLLTKKWNNDKKSVGTSNILLIAGKPKRNPDQLLNRIAAIPRISRSKCIVRSHFMP
jgi:hypothetical protein